MFQGHQAILVMKVTEDLWGTTGSEGKLERMEKKWVHSHATHSDQRLFQLHTQGEPGFPGPTGMEGNPGDVGPPGATGLNGRDGRDGRKVCTLFTLGPC